MVQMIREQLTPEGMNGIVRPIMNKAKVAPEVTDWKLIETCTTPPSLSTMDDKPTMRIPKITTNILIARLVWSSEILPIKGK